MCEKKGRQAGASWFARVMPAQEFADLYEDRIAKPTLFLFRNEPTAKRRVVHVSWSRARGAAGRALIRRGGGA